MNFILIIIFIIINVQSRGVSPEWVSIINPSEQRFLISEYQTAGDSEEETQEVLTSQ